MYPDPPSSSPLYIPNLPSLLKRSKVLSPSWLSSAILLISFCLGYISLQSVELYPSILASQVATIVGVGLLISIAIDLRKGLRNIFRIDLLCLTSLYGLTLLEFLFPQPQFDKANSIENTHLAIQAVLLGFAGLTIGRHWGKKTPIQVKWLQFNEISNRGLFSLYIFSAFLGYFWMLISVQFNIITMISAFVSPRFSQPWSRGRLGDITALISELKLFVLLVPALFGMILARRKDFPLLWFWISTSIFFLTLFQGFCSGTRTILVMYVSAFLAGYLLNLPRNTIQNTVLPIMGGIATIFFATYYMSQFRTIGLGAYLRGYRKGFLSDTFFVDYNLSSLGKVIAAIPQNHNFLGSELFYWGLIRPIPRALFPWKPEGLSVSIEEIVGAKGWTVATTYLGESYMSGGWVAIVLVSLGIGVLTAWWNRLSIQNRSSYTMLVYASGFGAAAITMRSMLETSTVLLPVLALILYPQFIAKSLKG